MFEIWQKVETGGEVVMFYENCNIERVAVIVGDKVTWLKEGFVLEIKDVTIAKADEIKKLLNK